jgi:hypothetical protein
MPPRILIAIALLARIANAGECADLPLCARVAQTNPVFFVGEAVAERHRQGHQPEYLFRIREVLTGIASNSEHAVVETDEGPPPAGLLLVEARLAEGGRLTRGECDLAEPDSSAFEMLAALRRLHSSEASLRVAVTDVRGRTPEELRVLVDGPISRPAERDGKFPHLVAGAYRITASAHGYEAKLHDTELRPGSCQTVEILLAGTAEIAGLTAAGRMVQAIDADSQAIAATTAADSQGRYRLSALPPGRYVLSTGSLFYPGEPRRIDASVILLGPAGKVELRPWSLR